MLALADQIQAFFQTSPVDPGPLSESLWLILAFPLVGALMCGLLGKTLGREGTGVVACATVLGSFLLSALAFWAVNSPKTSWHSAFSADPINFALGQDLGTWFSVGSFRVDLGLRVDHLSGTMLMVITGVGFLIHLYSTSYMEHDEGYWRFFAYLNLFVGAMLTLVLADSLPMLFIGWEGVGLCSYLLIGFWYTDSAKAWAGRKAFITNRIGDFGFLVATFLLVLVVSAFTEQASAANFPRAGTREAFHAGLSQRGPLDFQGLEEMANAVQAEGTPGAVTLQTPIADGPLAGIRFGAALTAVLMLFLLGAAGKSAQLPLYVWLPDAMAGPTPVSALIHAATMVTAGVYLFCRLSALLVLSPAAMALIAVVGALTALFAALIAFAQDDIKKVLAYSTVSQLGFMFLGVGMGVFWAAMLHLVTHAFFKACLFLGAGSVMHGNGDETDIKKLGGLRRQMPLTWITFLISTLAITGVVPLSGFFSKDAILHGASETTLKGFPSVGGLVQVVGLVAAVCTAFYMTRLYLLTFEGQRSPQAKVAQAHESAWPMTLPLLLLAFLAVVAAAEAWPLMHVGAQTQPVMENFLWPVFLHAQHLARRIGTVTFRGEGGAPWGAWALTLVLAWAGAGAAAFAYLRYFPTRTGQTVPAAARRLRSLAQNKFYVDEIYDVLIVQPVKWLSFLLYRAVDEVLIDGIAVRGTAWLTARLGAALRYAQTGDAQTYAGIMALALLAGVSWVFATFAQVAR
jgi:NADH-quinone oxidoreductase subunit L